MRAFGSSIDFSQEVTLCNKHSLLFSPGDRIHSVTISLDNVVFEDALTILSYASPYPVTLDLSRASQAADSVEGTDHAVTSIYRSQSLDDVRLVTNKP